MSAPGQLDVPRARDRAGEVPRVLDVADLVVDGMEDQRGHPDRRRDVARRYGGEAFAESQGEGLGSTFTLRLPRVYRA